MLDISDVAAVITYGSRTIIQANTYKFVLMFRMLPFIAKGRPCYHGCDIERVRMRGFCRSFMSQLRMNVLLVPDYAATILRARQKGRSQNIHLSRNRNVLMT